MEVDEIGVCVRAGLCVSLSGGGDQGTGYTALRNVCSLVARLHPPPPDPPSCVPLFCFSLFLFLDFLLCRCCVLAQRTGKLVCELGSSGTSVE